MLGVREPGAYGSETLAPTSSVSADGARRSAAARPSPASSRTSEGELVEAVHAARGAYDGIVYNPGAHTHYSYALRDAVGGIDVPLRRGAHLGRRCARAFPARFGYRARLRGAGEGPRFPGLLRRPRSAAGGRLRAPGRRLRAALPGRPGNRRRTRLAAGGRGGRSRPADAACRDRPAQRGRPPPSADREPCRSASPAAGARRRGPAFG